MIRHNFNLNVAAWGEVKLEDGGKIISDKKNTITNNGLIGLVYSLLDNAMPFFYIAVGDEVSPNLEPDQIVNQTQLQSEISRNDTLLETTVLKNEEYDNVYTYTVQAEFGGVVNQELHGISVTEIGLFDNYGKGGGTMFARQAPDVDYTFDTQSKLKATWKIHFAISPSLADNGGVVNTAAKILGDAMKRNSPTALKSEGYPWGLNSISFGENDVPNSLDQEDLNEGNREYDSLPTVTNVDFSGSSGLNFKPKLIIQNYIPENTIPFDIKEVGLFNRHDESPQNAIGTTIEARTMFSRVPLSVPIEADMEAVLTWQIKVKRQETIVAP